MTPEIEAFLKAEALLRPQVGGDRRCMSKVVISA